MNDWRSLVGLIGGVFVRFWPPADSMTRVPISLCTVLMLAGCASVAKDRMEQSQTRLYCGMSVKQAEAAVGGVITPLDVPTAEATHYYRRGSGDLRFRFEGDKLRSSQVVVVTGWTSAEEEALVNHCK